MQTIPHTHRFKELQMMNPKSVDDAAAHLSKREKDDYLVNKFQ